MRLRLPARACKRIFKFSCSILVVLYLIKHLAAFSILFHSVLSTNYCGLKMEKRRRGRPRKALVIQVVATGEGEGKSGFCQQDLDDLRLLKITEIVNPFAASKMKRRPKWSYIAEKLNEEEKSTTRNDRNCRERV